MLYASFNIFFRSVIYCYAMFSLVRGTLGPMQTLVGRSIYAIKGTAGLVESCFQIWRGSSVSSLSKTVFSRTVRLKVNGKSENLLGNHFVWARYQHTKSEIDRGPAYRFMNDTEKIKLEYLRERATLSKSLTPELEEQIVQGKRGKKYLLHQVKIFFCP